MKCRGFSLIELLVALSVLALLAGFAAPDFKQQISSAHVRSTSSALVETLNLARSTAVLKNQRVVVRPEIDWSSGWKIFIDSNSDGLLSPDETLLKKFTPPPQVRIYTTSIISSYVSYVGSGSSEKISGAFLNGTLRICPASGEGGGIAAIIRVGGRIRTEQLSSADCATSR